MVAPTRSHRLSPYLMAVPAAVLLMVYALVNGVPFTYPDAFVYLAYGETAWQRVGGLVAGLWPMDIPADVTVIPGAGAAVGTLGAEAASDADWTPAAGRSVYYGLLSAFPGLLASPWNGILLQAYCSALSVALGWRAMVGTIGPGYLAAMGAFGLFTTFGIFAATAMPDVWAATSILALALLVALPGRIERLDGIVLWSFVLFSALAHSTHLAVLALITVLCVAARLTRLTTLRWRTIATMAAVLVVAALLVAGGRLAMERAAGNAPRGMPFFTAHLVDGGPGMDFIRAACPGSGFAVCEREDLLPVEWRVFIFKLPAPDEYNRRLVAEDVSFALATLRHDPAGVIGLALRDAARQVAMIGLVTTPIRAAIGESAAVRNSPRSLATRVRAGRLYDADWLYRYVSAINTALVLAAAVTLAFVATRPDFGAQAGGVRRLLVMTVAGLLLNAAVCGVLASPYDRFQARVAWLVPVLAVIALAAYSRDRRLHPSGRTSRS